MSRRARQRRDKRAPWPSQDDDNQAAVGRFCNQARILRNALEPAWILGLCVCIQRRKSAVFAQLVKKFPCGLGRQRLLRPAQQRPIRINLPTQQHYFGVSPSNNFSEFSDHSDAFDNMLVEGFKSIRKTAAGSGVGLGLRAISGGSTLGAEAQPLNASKISAGNSIARGLRNCEGIAVLLSFCGVGGFGGGGLLLVL